MKKISDLLLVVENNHGMVERNMLYTKKEFFAYLKQNDAAEMVNDVHFLLSHKNSKFGWKTLHIAGGSLEFRCCRDEQDLIDFMEGKYNDSVEKMRERGLPSMQRLGGFRWEVALSSFPPKAMQIFDQLCQTMPRLKSACHSRSAGMPRLDDVIARCQQESSLMAGNRSGMPLLQGISDKLQR